MKLDTHCPRCGEEMDDHTHDPVTGKVICEPCGSIQNSVIRGQSHLLVR